MAAYEALAYALKELVSVFSPLALDLLMENYKSSPPNADSKKPLLDSFVWTFLQNINNLIAVGNLVRTRRAVLINWKVIVYFVSYISIMVYVVSPPKLFVIVLKNSKNGTKFANGCLFLFFLGSLDFAPCYKCVIRLTPTPLFS